MADRDEKRRTETGWAPVQLVTDDDTKRTLRAWSCTNCQFVLGGPSIDRPPTRCPMCTVAAGHVVAVVPGDDARVTLVALDRRFRDLLESFRVAKREHEQASAESAAAERLGNYDLDDPGSVRFGDDAHSSGAREQRSAIALAEAVSEQSPNRSSRTSTESISRPSHPT